MSYTIADYQALLAELQNLAVEGRAEFHKKLIPQADGELVAYGVPMGDLRKLAKRIAKEDYAGFLAVARDDSHEEVLLQGFVVAYAKNDFDEWLKNIAWFVDKIDNWAVCDSFCVTLKNTEKHREEVFAFLSPYLASSEEYKIRFGVVMLLDYYITPEYIDETLRILSGISHDGYYVKMAVAWTLAECFIKFRDKTLPLIAAKSLDRFTQNKAIQKARESFRVSDTDKQLLSSFRL